MKISKKLLGFFIVFFVNIVLGFLLYKYNSDIDLGLSIILVFSSYVVYWLLNLYLIFLKKTNQISNYTILLIVGFIACLISLITMIFNLKNDFILFFPMMFIFSMLCTFINWIFFETKETT